MQYIVVVLVILLSIDYVDRNIEWEYTSKGDLVSKRYTTLIECQHVQGMVGGTCKPKWRR
jgi:hypothetical protein